MAKARINWSAILNDNLGIFQDVPKRIVPPDLRSCWNLSTKGRRSVIPPLTEDQKAAIERLSAHDAKLKLLDYLIGVAQKTEGAAVWRALFAEMRASTELSFDDD